MLLRLVITRAVPPSLGTMQTLTSVFHASSRVAALAL